MSSNQHVHNTQNSNMVVHGAEVEVISKEQVAEQERLALQQAQEQAPPPPMTRLQRQKKSLAFSLSLFQEKARFCGLNSYDIEALTNIKRTIANDELLVLDKADFVVNCLSETNYLRVMAGSYHANENKGGYLIRIGLSGNVNADLMVLDDYINAFAKYKVMDIVTGQNVTITSVNPYHAILEYAPLLGDGDGVELIVPQIDGYAPLAVLHLQYFKEVIERARVDFAIPKNNKPLELTQAQSLQPIVATMDKKWLGLELEYVLQDIEHPAVLKSKEQMALNHSDNRNIETANIVSEFEGERTKRDAPMPITEEEFEAQEQLLAEQEQGAHERGGRGRCVENPPTPIHQDDEPENSPQNEAELALSLTQTQEQTPKDAPPTVLSHLRKNVGVPTLYAMTYDINPQKQ